MVTGMIFCHGCGKEIHSSAPTCPHCGAQQRTRTSKGKRKLVAGLLAIFLGGLGIHRFYLGQWQGIFYLFLFWTLVPMIVAFIEGIVFLLTSDESWDEKYNQGIPNIGGRGSNYVAVAIVAAFIMGPVIIGILAAIAIPQFAAYRHRAYAAEIRSDLKNAANAQELYFDKNSSYKSCAACTSRNLPGYDNNPKVTLVAEVGKTEFVLIAAHERCGDSVWTYQSTTKTIIDPSGRCN